MLQKTLNIIPEPIKLVGDGSAIAVTAAVIMTYVPPMAAVASLVWAILRCYNEYLTMKQLKKKKR